MDAHEFDNALTPTELVSEVHAFGKNCQSVMRAAEEIKRALGRSSITPDI